MDKKRRAFIDDLDYWDLPGRSNMTVFEEDDYVPTGLLDANGRPLSRKRIRPIGFRARHEE